MPGAHRLTIAALARLSDVWVRTPAGRPDLLRILAYHGISHPAKFEMQLQHLVDRYQPITAYQVLDALSGSRLPRRSVWVTFDDGDPSVVEHGLEALKRHGVEATLFVCPGFIDTSEPYWWQVVDAAAENAVSIGGRVVTTETRAQMKEVPDAERRRTVSEIRDALESKVSRPLTRPQLTTSQLSHWIEAGNQVGNHTWDHPLLNQCSPGQQEEQIVAAHGALADRLGEPPTLFAYPNGNWSQTSEDVLNRLGYQGAVLFDHRLARPTDSLRLSRLRTGADTDTDRFRAIVSGMHSFGYRLLRR